jgi:acyl dehydratase
MNRLNLPRSHEPRLTFVLHSESRPGGYTRADLEPLSFDDLPLGGEWKTRRRTVSESDIALYAGVSGDFSPLTIEATHGTPRVAPPALLVAMAVGLGSMDMPVPSIAEWEWLNWRFPHPVHAGDTIYARWTLTQKRPPARDAHSSIVVWRVDVHTADGTLCAEGEVGAKVRRQPVASPRPRASESAAAGPATAGTAAPRRRRRRRPGSNGHVTEPAAATAVTIKTEPAAPATTESAALAKTRAPGAAAPKRRRRRRAPSAAGQREGEPAAPSPPSTPTPAAKAAPPPAAESSSGTPDHQSPIGRVISRLRRS